MNRGGKSCRFTQATGIGRFFRGGAGMARRRHDDRQYDLFGDPAGHIARAARSAKAAVCRAAWRHAVQMELSAEWGLRECKSHHHEGNPLIPIEQFVKNGAFRRHTCRTCWAIAQRERAAAADQNRGSEQALLGMLNRLWRPMTAA